MSNYRDVSVPASAGLCACICACSCSSQPSPTRRAAGARGWRLFTLDSRNATRPRATRRSKILHHPDRRETNRHCGAVRNEKCCCCIVVIAAPTAPEAVTSDSESTARCVVLSHNHTYGTLSGLYFVTESKVPPSTGNGLLLKGRAPVRIAQVVALLAARKRLARNS